MLFSSTCQPVGSFFSPLWKHFRSDVLFFFLFLLVKCHWQVLTWKLKLAVSNLSYCICKQLTFPSLSLGGKEVKPDSRQGFLTNIPTCIHNAPFSKKEKSCRSIWCVVFFFFSRSAQRIPSVQGFYGLRAILSTLESRCMATGFTRSSYPCIEGVSDLV